MTALRIECRFCPTVWVLNPYDRASVIQTNRSLGIHIHRVHPKMVPLMMRCAQEAIELLGKAAKLPNVTP